MSSFSWENLVWLDQTGVKALNSYVGAWPLFDTVVHAMNANPLFKGYIFISALWFVGSRRGESGDYFLLRWLGGLFLALVAARLVQDFGPFHARPINTPELGLRAFRADDSNYFQRMSSFPSDHAALFFAMATALFSKVRRIGLLGFVWAALIVCLPRVYFGYHYPSDVIVGAVLGVLVMACALYLPLPRFVLARLERFELAWPGAAMGAAFFISAEIAVNFDNIRALATLG